MAGSPSSSKRPSRDPSPSHETTPLLRGDGDETSRSYGDQVNGRTSPAAHSLRSFHDDTEAKSKSRLRLATPISLLVLCLIAVVIMVVGFVVPSTVEAYAKEAGVFEPTKLSIDSFTTTGVKARIEGNFELDPSKVNKKSVRDIGKAATWVAKEVSTGNTKVKVYLPAYDNLLLGTATIPPLKVNIRPHHANHIEFVSDLQPGEIESYRRIADDWLHGRLGRLEVKGVATVNLKSGFFKLPTQTISQYLVFEGETLPAIPKYKVSKLNFQEVERQGTRLMIANASVSFDNSYPLHLDVPELGFDILVPNCSPEQDRLVIAKAVTNAIDIRPLDTVNVSVSALIKPLDAGLTETCPGSKSSPLDSLLAGYIAGHDTTIFVRGSDALTEKTPGWVTDLTKSVTVPLPFPGHSFDQVIRNFSLANVHFTLPDPTAEPDKPEASPRLSATVQALVGLPKEMDFPLDVNRVRADAEVFYHGKKLGELDLHPWQMANTTRVEEKIGPALLVESFVENAPLRITDDDVFTEVIQKLVFGAEGIALGVKAKVDVETVTALGDFVVRDVPAEGQVFVKPISGGMGFSGLKPSVGNLKILETSRTTLTLQAIVNLTNPTVYSAHIPFIDIHILHNGTVLGHATARDLTVIPGNNTDMLVQAVWNPLEASGENGSKVGRDLLSQYISGFNTTLTLKTHESSIPLQPRIGKALSAFEVTMDTPKLVPPKAPGQGDQDSEESGPRFIKDATMHLLSSSATFTLLSPLPKTVLYITSLSATALYNHTEPVGTIDYDLPFAVPPGASTTPRLPVSWSLGGTGYDAVRDALGGSLKLDATAEAGIRIGQWQQDLWFVGGGIGAHIRL